MLLLALLTLVLVEAGAGAGAAPTLPVTVAQPGPGDQLLVPAGESSAVLRLELPPADPGMPAYVLWLPRVPLDSLLLHRDGWSSPELAFFYPTVEEGLFPAGYRIHLPRTWEGETEAVIQVSSRAATVMRPLLLTVDGAVQIEQRVVAASVSVYAALLTLALLSLALYAAAHDHVFLTLSGCAMLALLMLAAGSGHLYAIPGLRLLGNLGPQGSYALLMLFLASWLVLLQRYLGLAHRGPVAVATAMAAVAAVFLLDVAALDPVARPLSVAAWLGTGVVSVLLLVNGGQRGVAMAWPAGVVVLVTLVLRVLRELAGEVELPPLLVTRHAFQLGIVVVLVLLAVGLVSRIREYREQRDRDRLVRADAERRMQREAVRTDLVNALHMRLRDRDGGDMAALAFGALVEHLVPLVPIESLAVVARGYQGKDLVMAHPPSLRAELVAEIERRELQLRRQAANGIAQQVVRDGAMEAVIPLQMRLPSWGAVLLCRTGSEGFTTDEMALATEFVRIAQMQTDEAILSAQLRRSAELDALTNCLNRRSIDRWLDRSFVEAERLGHPLSVLFVDLDHFKAINDRHGHAGGDHCLRQVASALRRELDSADLLGRYGGEEFIVILPGRAGAAARQAGEAMRSAVERLEIEWEGRPVRLTVSVGVATRTNGEQTPEAMVARADKALYSAKRGGRNCVHVAPAVFS